VHPPSPLDGEHVYDAATFGDATIVVAMLNHHQIDCRVLPEGDGRRFAFVPVDDQEETAVGLIERWAPDAVRVQA